MLNRRTALARSAQVALMLGGLGLLPRAAMAAYRAPEPLKTLPIPPVAWQVDEIRLVAGQGRPYRYEVLDRWRLLQPPASPQLPLF